MIVEIRTERKEITFIKSMDGGKEPHTTCFLSICGLWLFKVIGRKVTWKCEAHKQHNSLHSHRKNPLDLEMENEIISSCRSKYFWNNVSYNILPKKLVISAWLYFLVDQSYVCCLTGKCCISLPPSYFL